MYEIKDRTVDLYSPVCLLISTFKDGWTLQGSAVVVGFNDVLTAKHLVYSGRHGGYATSITIIPAADTAPVDRPYGVYTDVKTINLRAFKHDLFEDEFLTARESEQDLALLGLGTRIGDATGWMGASAAYSSFEGRTLGYPGVGAGMMADDVFVSAPGNWTAPHNGIKDPMLFVTTHSLGQGASGGPVIQIGKDGIGNVMGVLSTLNPEGTGNYASLASPGTWDWYIAALTSNNALVPAAASELPLDLRGSTGDETFDLGAITLGPLGALLTDPGGIDTIKLPNGRNTISLSFTRINIKDSYVDFAAGTVIENVIGGAAADYIYGNSSSNYLSGGEGNDSLGMSAGEDILDGGPGHDTVLCDSWLRQLSVTKVAEGYRVTAGGSTALLISVEQILTFDGGISWDVSGSAGQAYRLYQAALGRAPDPLGLGYHKGTLDAGRGVAYAAQNFIDSPEFARAYGPLNDVGFITQLYRNVLHREPDAAGLAFYSHGMASGASTRANVLAAFSESPENQVALTGVMQGGMTYLFR